MLRYISFIGILRGSSCSHIIVATALIYKLQTTVFYEPRFPYLTSYRIFWALSYVSTLFAS